MSFPLSCECRIRLPDLLADPDRLAQVFGNLINNSLHHAPQGGEIVLFARREEKVSFWVYRITDLAMHQN